MDLFPFDDDYVRRLREGDRFTGEHFGSYFPPLLRIVLRGMGVQADNIEDIIQETLMRALAAVKADKIRDGHAFGGFVATVCRNTAQEGFRKSPRTESLGDRDVWPSGDDPQREILSREEARRVHVLLDEMKGRDGDILKALFLKERDKDEVCRTFGIDRDYLRVLIHRAKQEFRKRAERDPLFFPDH
jgi:RNA polymerase sigma-70 factor (ECF subfamily)